MRGYAAGHHELQIVPAVDDLGQQEAAVFEQPLGDDLTADPLVEAPRRHIGREAGDAERMHSVVRQVERDRLNEATADAAAVVAGQDVQRVDLAGPLRRLAARRATHRQTHDRTLLILGDDHALVRLWILGELVERSQPVALRRGVGLGERQGRQHLVGHLALVRSAPAVHDHLRERRGILRHCCSNLHGALLDSWLASLRARITGMWCAELTRSTPSIKKHTRAPTSAKTSAPVYSCTSTMSSPGLARRGRY
jgi:hypothetical protein